jgi:hypothetical protein
VIFLVLLGAEVAAEAVATAADVASFESKVVVVEQLLDAANRGDARTFDRLTGTGAKAKIDFKPQPFSMETFARFKADCVFNRERTIAFDRYRAIHLIYDCPTYEFTAWSFNIWVDAGKVRLISANGLAPSIVGGVR